MIPTSLSPIVFAGANVPPGAGSVTAADTQQRPRRLLEVNPVVRAGRFGPSTEFYASLARYRASEALVEDEARASGEASGGAARTARRRSGGAAAGDPDAFAMVPLPVPSSPQGAFLLVPLPDDEIRVRHLALGRYGAAGDLVADYAPRGYLLDLAA